MKAEKREDMKGIYYITEEQSRVVDAKILAAVYI